MSEHDSIASWLLGARAGNPAAAERLWHGYFERLVRPARQHLPSYRRRAFDEEDVAQMAHSSLNFPPPEGVHIGAMRLE
jgi:hypothetical protein